MDLHFPGQLWGLLAGFCRLVSTSVKVRTSESTRGDTTRAVGFSMHLGREILSTHTCLA